MDLSVVIPSYDSDAVIERTLACLDRQRTRAEYEILVVDCSPHERVKRIAERYPRVRFVSHPTRFNPGEGRNIGARAARGRLLVFIDADVRLAEGALENAWLQYTAGHGIFGGALELDTENHAGLSAYLEHWFFNHESQRGRPACERKNLSSALLCIDAEIFARAGGFKDIPRMQDTELTERLRAGGESLRFAPDVVAFQTQDSPLPKVFRKIYINGQNLYYIRYRDRTSAPGKWVFAALLPVMGAAKTLRIVARHLRYQSAPNKLRTLFLGPVLAAAGATWTAGLLHALVTERGIGATR